MTSSRTLKIGIVGTGNIARSHAQAYKELPDVEIVAACDVVPGKAQAFIDDLELTRATAFEDHQRMLAGELDAVSVCTPNVAHHRTSIDAMEAGKHVLVEKPMAVTLDQAVEMARTARQTGMILSIGFQSRYDPNMRRVKDVVRSGQLGKVYYVETGAGRRRGLPGGTFIRKELAGAGALADIGCYALDFVLDALGHPKPLTVSAYASNLFGTNPKYHAEAGTFEVEDFGAALIRLEGDVVLSFTTSWAMHMDSLGPAVFLGTDAGMKVTPGPSGTWHGPIESITIYHDLMGQGTQSPLPVRSHNVRIFFEKVRDFVTAVREAKPAPVPGEQIVYNQAIIDGILRSAAAGREVEIEIPQI